MSILNHTFVVESLSTSGSISTKEYNYPTLSGAEEAFMTTCVTLMSNGFFSCSGSLNDLNIHLENEESIRYHFYVKKKESA